MARHLMYGESQQLLRSVLQKWGQRSPALGGVSVSVARQSAQLSGLKEVRPECCDIHSQVLQDVLTRLDRAFQACSGCGVMVRKGLSVRWHSCPDCGASLDRDGNAARNIDWPVQSLGGAVA